MIVRAVDWLPPGVVIRGFDDRVRVRRVVPGCWEVECPCCPAAPVVAQVGSWERAMRRAGEHVQEVHG